jgi:hypothetical protein
MKTIDNHEDSEVTETETKLISNCELLIAEPISFFDAPSILQISNCQLPIANFGTEKIRIADFEVQEQSKESLAVWRTPDFGFRICNQ